MSIQKLQANRIILGNWDTETAQADFDKTIFDEVLYWSYRANHWFKLEGFIILESSHKDYKIKEKGKIIFKYRKASYHVVFNRPVDWTRNVHIINWLGLESGNEGLKKWVIMQDIKESSTLRISNKGKKSIPKIIFHYGLQDKQIKKYLETRNLILNFLRKKRRR